MSCSRDDEVSSLQQMLTGVALRRSPIKPVMDSPLLSRSAHTGCRSPVGTCLYERNLSLLVLCIGLGESGREPFDYGLICQQAIESFGQRRWRPAVSTLCQNRWIKKSSVVASDVGSYSSIPCTPACPIAAGCRCGLAVASAARNSQLNWAALKISLRSETGQIRTEARGRGSRDY